jgi:hypothetical protein
LKWQKGEKDEVKERDGEDRHLLYWRPNGRPLLSRGVKMARGVPRRDGSGMGIRANKGRGGCSPTQSIGRGRNQMRRLSRRHRRKISWKRDRMSESREPWEKRYKKKSRGLAYASAATRKRVAAKGGRASRGRRRR